MTVFDKLKSKNIDELAEWINEYGQFDDSPWIDYWNDNYCKKCEEVVAYAPYLERDIELSWCDLHDNCKFFPDIEGVVDGKGIIKIWLESECKDE